MMRFADWVPVMIHSLLLRKQNVKDLDEYVETLWHWNLYPLIMVTAQVYLRNSKDAFELRIMKEMQSSYDEFLASDFYKEVKSLRKKDTLNRG